jgi:AAHS family 4-hydroxybenzoate transporter-like MFS transporter
MSSPTVNIDELIDRQDVRRTLFWVLFWSATAMIADGYDLLSIAFVAPPIMKAWGLGKPDFAVVFGVSAAASMLGGVACGYLADRVGRKKAIIFGTLVLGLSTLGSVFATNLTQLLVWRAIASFGIGTVPPVAIVIVNEFAPQRLRATIVAALYLGTTLGVLLAGLVAKSLVPQHGWQIMFLIGGLAPLAVCVGLVFRLPESPRFLVTRRPNSPELARIAARLAPSTTFAPDTRFVTTSELPVRGVPLRLLFVEGRWRTTLLFWMAYFASGLTLYTMLNWSPIILQSLGINAARAALIASWASVTGWIGGVIITRCMDRFGLRAMILPPLIGIPLVAGLGYLTGAPEVMIAAVSLLGGMAFSGGHAGIHATGALIYPTVVRANGVGLGLLVTRFAGVVAPAITGLIYTSDKAVMRVLWATALPLAVVSACYIGLARLNRQKAA